MGSGGRWGSALKSAGADLLVGGLALAVAALVGLVVAVVAFAPALLLAALIAVLAGLSLDEGWSLAAWIAGGVGVVGGLTWLGRASRSRDQGERA